MTSLNIETKWLSGIRRVPSENCDQRPLKTEVELVVLHAISLPPEKFGGNYIEDFFTNSLDWSADSYFNGLRDLKVSSHLFVDRAGHVTQFVELDKRAWHAGKSYWKGREACNDFSIGIELEGCDSLPFEAVQYDSLVGLLIRVFAIYPSLKIDSIVGHNEIAPDRKTDPGPLFDWELLRKKIAKLRV